MATMSTSRRIARRRSEEVHRHVVTSARRPHEESGRAVINTEVGQLLEFNRRHQVCPRALGCNAGVPVGRNRHKRVVSRSMSSIIVSSALHATHVAAICMCVWCRIYIVFKELIVSSACSAMNAMMVNQYIPRHMCLRHFGVHHTKTRRLLSMFEGILLGDYEDPSNCFGGHHRLSRTPCVHCWSTSGRRQRASPPSSVVIPKAVETRGRGFQLEGQLPRCPVYGYELLKCWVASAW